MKPWHNIPIIDNKEKLIVFPNSFRFVKPHPYIRLGAPYRNLKKLWSLRETVLSKLIKANEYLKSLNNQYNLIIYDSWRPIEIQEYLFYLAMKEEFRKLGLSLTKYEINNHPEIIKKVEKFWAYPSLDSTCPPPHSTGAAVDLSLSDRSGGLVFMGSAIDQMDKISYPNHFENINTKESILWHQRRTLLKDIMTKFGFAQHPNEWWHFSYGDQLWAWKTKKSSAIYGNIKY